jgi:hypothetical protein
MISKGNRFDAFQGNGMFAADVATYLINLDNAEAKRWAEVILREQPVAHRLTEEAGAEFERVPELVRWVFARLYQAFGGLYRGEMASWAEALGVSLGTVTILNCAYELSHLRWPKLFGCTAGIRWVDGLGLVHKNSPSSPPSSQTPTTTRCGWSTRIGWRRRGTRTGAHTFARPFRLNGRMRGTRWPAWGCSRKRSGWREPRKPHGRRRFRVASPGISMASMSEAFWRGSRGPQPSCSRTWRSCSVWLRSALLSACSALPTAWRSCWSCQN